MATRANIGWTLENMIAASAGTSTPKVIHKTEDGITICRGTAVPDDGVADTYAPGCIFIHVDGSGSRDSVYINKGTYASCNFDAVFAMVQQSAITTELTDLTHTAPSSPDYAIQDFVDAVTGAYAFKDKDEANTVLKVIQANKVRIQAIEDALQAVGILA